MSPDFSSSTNTMTAAACFTSPWTEVYEAADAGMMQAGTQTVSQPHWTDDAQQPTHDALSDMYNF